MIVVLRLNLKRPKAQDLQILTALALHHRGRIGKRAREAYLRLVGDPPIDSVQSELGPPAPADCPSG